MSLPPLASIYSSPSSTGSDLAKTLVILFEHSPILVDVLEKQLNVVVKSSQSPPTSYTQLIDTALAEIAKWDIPAQAEFISGHPRIGENSNLSKLSAAEQGARGLQPTPPEVLNRLVHLNVCYEVKFPGLRYITFVNGRSRAAIAEEMEDMLGFEHSLSADSPSLDAVSPIEKESEEWRMELQRAIVDIGRIAKSRLGSLGVQ
ncbi:Oxo-4-hydroxy-4-carboxy-5-ureidoimidazoline decarboxylase [Panaeolus papilionaceus]|nr:Oxo-4-hydroxy-4-carboxy-5-ureidoimidazoline decarboxylase [Panaeolus papilionaceus]